MPTNRSVERDVARAMMYVIIHNTLFDESSYSLDIVPAKKYPAGFEATLGAWRRTFAKVAARLRDPLEGGYRVRITDKDANDTLNKPLSSACALLVSKIG